MMEAGTVMIFLLPCRWFGTAGVQRGGTGAGEGLVLPDGMTCGLHTRNDGGGGRCKLFQFIFRCLSLMVNKTGENQSHFFLLILYQLANLQHCTVFQKLKFTPNIPAIEHC